MADSFTIWTSKSFRIAHAYSYRLPGYLFVENLVDARSLNSLSPEASGELGDALALAERLIHKIIHPERLYILKFGESDDRIHFHLIPRTRKLLDAYLATETDEPPYNGARITAWLWKNADQLGHSTEEIDAFVKTAKAEIAAS